jgi:hypothetical protein
VTPNNFSLKSTKEVILLHNAVDHPSNQTLKNALNNNLILGSRLNSKDVDNYFKIYGKCINCIAGKITRPSYRDSFSLIAGKIGDIVHVDLHPFSNSTIANFTSCLICIDEFISYLFLVMIKFKPITFLNNAFLELISHFSLFDHTIKKN